MTEERTTRGFRIFGTVTSRDGGAWTVIESSLAFEGAHCRVQPPLGACIDHGPTGEHFAPDAHLSVAEAERLANTLMQFVREAREGKLMEPESR